MYYIVRTVPTYVKVYLHIIHINFFVMLSIVYTNITFNDHGIKLTIKFFIALIGRLLLITGCSCYK